MAKVVYFYGLTQEEVEKLSDEEFLKYIPSQYRRHIKRGLTKAEETAIKHAKAGKKKIKTHARNLILTPLFLGKTVEVYNGHEYVPVEVKLEMLAHRVGEFAPSTKRVIHSSAGVGASKSTKNIGRK